MKCLDTADSVAQRAAAIIAAEARTAVAARGRFVMAVSGGHTPWLMLRALASAERAVAGDSCGAGGRARGPGGTSGPESDAFDAKAFWIMRRCAAEQIHAMPVESPDLEAAAAEYAATLRQIAGSPPVLDLVHLGLGRTATRLRWSPAIRFSMSPMQTSR